MWTPGQGTLLVVAAHADDETLIAGGLLHRHARLGGASFVYVADADNDRRCELAAAAHVLGFGFPASACPRHPDDGWLDQASVAEVAAPVEAAVAELRPDCVVVPAWAAYHQEHRALAEACRVALRPSGGTGVYRPPVVLAGEAAADQWSVVGPQAPTPVFVQLDGVDVTAKMAAMGCHSSQVRPAPSERSFEAIEALAKLRGAQAGVPWAEAFEPLRLLL